MDLTGQLLVASSTVTDPIYSHGVCLIVHQDDSGVIGVMLNRPMQPHPGALLKTTGDKSNPRHRLAPEPDSSPADPIKPLGNVHFGGPLTGPVVAIHQMSQFAEAETGEGIYVAAERQHLEQLVTKQPCPYRLIVGHLGWDFEKLGEELKAGTWHLLPATADVVFCNATEMWPGLIRRATTRSMSHWLGLPDVIGVGELN